MIVIFYVEKLLFSKSHHVYFFVFQSQPTVSGWVSTAVVDRA